MRYADRFYLVFDDLKTATPAEVVDCATRLGVKFPDGYAEYVTELGKGLLSNYLRIWLPRKVEDELSEHRQFLSNNFFWDKNGPLTPKRAGVPKEVKFLTRHQLALEMLDECGKQLPHGWVAGDDEMGRSSNFRRELRARNERYLLAVPSNTLVRDLDVPPPEYAGRGRHPLNPFTRMDRWRAALPEDAWTRIDVRDGEKGPLVTAVVKRRVQARTDTGGTDPEELLFVTREPQTDGTFKHDYYLSNADSDVPLSELARVSKAEHRIEECLEIAKREAGLADYQVRNWPAWHHHQTLSLLAAWFLNQETRRGKNPDPRADDAAVQTADRGHHRGASQNDTPSSLCRRGTRWLRRNEQARLYHHRSRKVMPRLKDQLRM